MATKKKTGTKRKPAKGRAPAHKTPRVVLATALRSAINMTIVVTVSATVLGGLLAVKHFGV